MVQQPVTQPAEAPPPAPNPAALPALNVTGVVVDGERSSAVINGTTGQVGEYIEGVRLLEAAADGVAVASAGEAKSISLGGKTAAATQN